MIMEYGYCDRNISRHWCWTRPFELMTIARKVNGRNCDTTWIYMLLHLTYYYYDQKHQTRLSINILQGFIFGIKDDEHFSELTIKYVAARQ